MSKRNLSIIVLFFSVFVLGAQGQSRATLLYNQGMAFLQADDPYEAIIKLKESITVNPQYLEPLIALAESYYYLDEYDEALRFVERARPLGRENARLLNIQGRILLALGKPDDAATIFRSIQRREPYNIDALLGLAEFSLAKGDELTALQQYQKTLEYNPRDRRILLSLALMYEQRGDKRNSESFLQRALTSSPESPLVQTLASEYYLRNKRFGEAEYHAMTANSLAAPSYPKALEVLAKTYMAMEDPGKALVVLDQLISLDARDAQSWYLRGQALLGLQRYDDALQALASAINLNPSDEITRLVLENLLLNRYPPNHELRLRAGAYHFDQANQYLKKNLYSRAGFHFHRGTVLSPTSVEGRTARAEFFKTMGQHSLFLRELNVLSQTLGVSNNYIKDNQEIYTSLLGQSVSAQWKKDQFTIDRDPLVFRIFYNTSLTNLDHSKAEPFVADYFQGLLGTSDKVTFDVTGREFTPTAPRERTEATALRTAREERADYYVMVSFIESGEDFQAKADLYLARTGTKIRSYSTFRTGNFRVQNAIYQIVESIQKEVPLRGRLLDRKINDGLINLGSADGLKVGDVLHLISPDGYILRGESPGFEYSAEKKTGSITITRVDDKIAQGTIQREGFFDRTNLGDIVLRDGETVLRPSDPTSNFPFLYNRIRGIR